MQEIHTSAHCPTRLHVIIVYHFQERKYQIQHTCTFLARVMVWFKATHSYPSRQRDKQCCITQVESSCQISVHCTVRDKVVITTAATSMTTTATTTSMTITTSATTTTSITSTTTITIIPYTSLIKACVLSSLYIHIFHDSYMGN